MKRLGEGLAVVLLTFLILAAILVGAILLGWLYNVAEQVWAS